MAEPSQCVMVLDLDDTLYYEEAYSVSGIKAVASLLNSLFQKELLDEMLLAKTEGGDIWGLACEKLDLPMSVKDSLLWSYRLHEPRNISPSFDVVNVLGQLSDIYKRVAIVTDGRSLSQRLKLKALGLEKFPVYISEEFSSVKPDTARFEQIMIDFPADGYTYVGDNVKKDFIGPNKLGWKTVGVVGESVRIYPLEEVSDEEFANPDIWIEELPCLLDIQL